MKRKARINQMNSRIFTIIGVFVSMLLIARLLGIVKPAESIINGSQRSRALSTCSFNGSGLETFEWALHEVRRPRKRQLVLICTARASSCGGIADRIKGVPLVVALSLVSGRQFTLDPSLLTNAHGSAPANNEEMIHYNLVDNRCHDSSLIRSLLNDSASIIFVTSNCEWPSGVVLEPSLLNQGRYGSLVTRISKECSISPLLCGAAAVHSTEAFANDLSIVGEFVSGLFMLPFRDYTVLHIRAGGSTITVNNMSIPAVSWYDGYTTEIPQTWVDMFRTTSFGHCKKPVAVVSDSVRVVSELRFVCADRLAIHSCCSQPLHRDRSYNEEFFYQEVIDLYIMARARRVIAGVGSFAMLGRYWLGEGDGPQLTIVPNHKGFDAAMGMILKESECELW